MGMRFSRCPSVFLVLATVALSGFVAVSVNSPYPSVPISTVPGWSSWIDIYVFCPSLISVIAITFRRATSRELLILGPLAVLPMGLEIFVSYQGYYNVAGFTAETYYIDLIAEVATSVLLAAIIFLAPRIDWRGWMRDKRALQLVWWGGLFSVGFALLESGIRPISTSGTPLTWAGDIGITVAWGAVDLVHGVNIFAVGIPPWGGPAGPPYGPGSFLLAIPYSPFPIGLAAHLDAFTYAGLSVAMLWLTVRVFDRQLASFSALLFLAFPLTCWAMQATVSSHFMVTFLILVALYFFVSQKSILCGLALSAATLTLFFPALLLVPLLWSSRLSRWKFGLSFLIPTVTGVIVTVFWLPRMAARQGVQGIVSPSLGWIAYRNALGEPGSIILAAGVLLFLSLLLLGWREPRASSRSRDLIGVAVILLAIPAVIGYSYGAYYLWSTAAAVVALASLWNDASMQSSSKRHSEGHDRAHSEPPRSTKLASGTAGDRTVIST